MFEKFVKLLYSNLYIICKSTRIYHRGSCIIRVYVPLINILMLLFCLYSIYLTFSFKKFSPITAGVLGIDWPLCLKTWQKPTGEYSLVSSCCERAAEGQRDVLSLWDCLTAQDRTPSWPSLPGDPVSLSLLLGRFRAVGWEQVRWLQTFKINQPYHRHIWTFDSPTEVTLGGFFDSWTDESSKRNLSVRAKWHRGEGAV